MNYPEKSDFSVAGGWHRPGERNKCGARQTARIASITLYLVVCLVWLTACGQAPREPVATAPALAEEIVLYDWEEDMPQSVLDAFTEEYGVKVTYLTYESQEEVMENIQAGEVYDVVVIDNDVLPDFVADGLLAEIDFRNVSNFDNISANFRDLSYDPGNKHSIPYSWGTTAIAIHTDLVTQPVTRWADLWKLAETGKIALRADEAREPLGVALKSLGYSINSEDPSELRAAFDHLFEIRDSLVFVENYAEGAIPVLESGEAVALVAWAEDMLYGREQDLPLDYIYPEEGALLWGDNYAIPLNSPRKYTAEVFLNFLLRPEIGAQIVNDNYYATANEAAREFIDPEIINDWVVFPPNEDIQNAEVFLPISPEATTLYNDLLAQLMASNE